MLKRTMEEQHKNLQAESAWVRRQWGATENSVESDDMAGHTFLGDVHQTAPQPIIVSQPQQSSSLLPTLIAAGLGMLGPAGAVGGYFLKEFLQSEKPVAISPSTVQNTIREEMKIRLLTEDELKQP